MTVTRECQVGQKQVEKKEVENVKQLVQEDLMVDDGMVLA